MRSKVCFLSVHHALIFWRPGQVQNGAGVAWKHGKILAVSKGVPQDYGYV